MPTITNKIIKAKRGGLLAVMAISTLGLVSTALSGGPAYAQTKRALFASAAQCRTLTDENAGLCCFALNKRWVLSKQQLDMCPPLTTSAISTSSSSERSGGDGTSSGGKSSGGKAGSGSTGSGNTGSGNTGG
ncbi:MAG TPA: hypothetical protein VK602_10195, partial [Phyllobacterium sp.]|nr:hypothetical protein [Phyllobacterium sp.]